jgi:hypothetical protein
VPSATSAKAGRLARRELPHFGHLDTQSAKLYKAVSIRPSLEPNPSRPPISKRKSSFSVSFPYPGISRSLVLHYYLISQSLSCAIPFAVHLSPDLGFKPFLVLTSDCLFCPYNQTSFCAYNKSQFCAHNQTSSLRSQSNLFLRSQSNLFLRSQPNLFLCSQLTRSLSSDVRRVDSDHHRRRPHLRRHYVIRGLLPQQGVC